MTNVLLSDGRILDSRNFDIGEWPERKLGLPDKLAVQRAERACSSSTGCSVVLATRDDVVARVIGATTADEACARARRELAAYYREKALPIPNRGIAAVINFSPSSYNLLQIAALGAETLYLCVPIVETAPGVETALVRKWLGPAIGSSGEREIQRRLLIRQKPKKVVRRRYRKKKRSR